MQDEKKVILWKTPDVRVPSWIHELDHSVQFRIRSSRLFSGKVGAFADHKTGPLSFFISAPERAVYELLYDVPDQESFEEVRHNYQGLSTLRPKSIEARFTGIVNEQLFYMNRWYLPREIKKEWENSIYHHLIQEDEYTEVKFNLEEIRKYPRVLAFMGKKEGEKAKL